MKRQNKWLIEHIVQGNYGYGHGWEDLCGSEDRKEARADLKAYNENELGVPHRLIRRRVLNPAYEQPVPATA